MLLLLPSASGCPLASRNKSRGLDPTGTMPLSAVVTSSTTSATNNNTKYSSTSFGGRLTPPSVFDNQLTHNEDDLSAKYDLDKVNEFIF